MRGTELFTSSSFSYSLTTDVVLYPFFLTLLISSRSTTVSARFLPVFTLQCSLCLVFFTLPHSASSRPPLTPLLFLSPPISLTTPFLLYVSALYLSPVLSALRRFSAITPLHLLIPVLIQPSTHSCLASKYTTLANIHARTPTCASADCTNVPRGAWCVHALTPRLLCRKMSFVKGQGASISQLHQSAL